MAGGMWIEPGTLAYKYEFAGGQNRRQIRGVRSAHADKFGKIKSCQKRDGRVLKWNGWVLRLRGGHPGCRTIPPALIRQEMCSASVSFLMVLLDAFARNAVMLE
jgi:hypothetical protein